MFLVAPNPANETLRLSGLPSGNIRLSLLDATGRAVLNERSSSTVHDIDISGLSVGAYQVKVEVDGRASAQRVMIAR